MNSLEQIFLDLIYMDATNTKVKLISNLFQLIHTLRNCFKKSRTCRIIVTYSGRTFPLNDRYLRQFVLQWACRLNSFKARRQIVIRTWPPWMPWPWVLCLEMILTAQTYLGRWFIWQKQLYLLLNISVSQSKKFFLHHPFRNKNKTWINYFSAQPKISNHNTVFWLFYLCTAVFTTLRR